MVELTSYGLTGLTAMLVIAFRLAYSDALPATQEKSSHDLTDDVHMKDSPMIETGARSLRFQETVDEQQETAPASRLQKTSRDETGRGTIYRVSSRNDCGRLEAFHG